MSVIKAYMHDTTAPKENSSKLVKQRTSVVNKTEKI